MRFFASHCAMSFYFSLSRSLCLGFQLIRSFSSGPYLLSGKYIFQCHLRDELSLNEGASGKALIMVFVTDVETVLVGVK